MFSAISEGKTVLARFGKPPGPIQCPFCGRELRLNRGSKDQTGRLQRRPYFFHPGGGDNGKTCDARESACHKMLKEELARILRAEETLTIEGPCQTCGGRHLILLNAKNCRVETRYEEDLYVADLMVDSEKKAAIEVTVTHRSTVEKENSLKRQGYTIGEVIVDRKERAEAEKTGNFEALARKYRNEIIWTMGCPLPKCESCHQPIGVTESIHISKEGEITTWLTTTGRDKPTLLQYHKRAGFDDDNEFVDLIKSASLSREANLPVIPCSYPGESCCWCNTRRIMPQLDPRGPGADTEIRMRKEPMIRDGTLRNWRVGIGNGIIALRIYPQITTLETILEAAQLLHREAKQRPDKVKVWIDGALPDDDEPSWETWDQMIQEPAMKWLGFSRLPADKLKNIGRDRFQHSYDQSKKRTVESLLQEPERRESIARFLRRPRKEARQRREDEKVAAQRKLEEEIRQAEKKLQAERQEKKEAAAAEEKRRQEEEAQIQREKEERGDGLPLAYVEMHESSNARFTIRITKDGESRYFIGEKARAIAQVLRIAESGRQVLYTGVDPAWIGYTQHPKRWICTPSLKKTLNGHLAPSEITYPKNGFLEIPKSNP